jgi:hypothetical protein
MRLGLGIGMLLICYIKKWAIEVIHKRGESTKDLASLTMLVSWEIWKESNARVFQNQSTTSNMHFSNMKDEAAM